MTLNLELLYIEYDFKSGPCIEYDFKSRPCIEYNFKFGPNRTLNLDLVLNMTHT